MLDCSSVLLQTEAVFELKMRLLTRCHREPRIMRLKRLEYDLKLTTDSNPFFIEWEYFGFLNTPHSW